MANPNRKPVESKIRQRPAKSLTVFAGGAATVPEPLDEWLAATKTSWAAFWADEVAEAVRPADQSVLERLFTLRDMQSRALARWKKNPFVDGSQGQPVANPAFAEAMTLEKAVVALEDRFGGSPKARANLGLAFGQARLTAAQLNTMTESDDSDDDEILEGWEEADTGS